MAPPSPAVSVLLPVRDAMPYLEEALDSLERQTFRDFEIVAVDDGSSDGSADLLRQRAGSGSLLRCFRRPARGLVPTLNDGIDLCRGELIARMDADDLAHPRRLELQVEALRAEPELGVVSCLVEHFPRRKLAEGFRIYERWLNSLVQHREIMRDRFIESPVPHPSVIIRRSLLQRVGGYRQGSYPEDYDLWLRLAQSGARFRKLPRVLHRWRHHARRLTLTDRRYAVERFLACKAHHLAAGPLKGRDPVILWGAGRTGRRLSKHLLREGVRLRFALDIDPRKVGGTLRGLPVRSPEELRPLPEDGVVVTAVSSRGARQLIRRRLTGMGLEETRDFWCAA